MRFFGLNVEEIIKILCVFSKQKKNKGGKMNNTIIWADGAALVVGDDGVGAVCCVLADDLIAHHRAAVAHADLTWLWLPHIPVSKHLTIQGAASACA